MEVPKMSQIQSHTTAILLALVVMTSLVVAPAGVAVAQEADTAQGYSISLETPDELVASDGQRIGVEVDNTDGSSDLFSPIVEIPLPNSYNVSQSALDNAVVEYENGTTASVTDASVQESTFRDGDAVLLFGENVPQGSVYTYYVDVNVSEPGSTTLEAETRLLYNENDDDVTARTQQDVTASGFGTVGATVERPDGTAVSDTTVTINGSSVGTGSTVVERVQGTYSIGATTADTAPVTLPTFTRTVGIGANETVSYIIPQSLDEPTVIGTTRSATVIDGSASQVTTQPATAEQVKMVETSFLLQTTGETAVVAMPVKSGVGPVDSRTVTADGDGTATVNETSTAPNIQITATDDTTVTVTNTGYQLGDANKDGQVNDADASAIAQTVAELDTDDQYADVDGDDAITATDAMYIEQYTNGNRTADYSQGDSL